MVSAFDQRITTRLTFAVSLTDDYTGREEVIGNVGVSVPDHERDAVKNPSGYYTFLDLPEVLSGEYIVRVESLYYVESEVTVTPASLDADAPVESISLMPSHLYPFPSGATLLRGVVSDPGGSAVSGAEVRWEVGTVIKNTAASGKGEFVLYFPVDYFPAGVEMEAIQIQAAPPGGAFTLINTEVHKCKTTSLSVVI